MRRTASSGMRARCRVGRKLAAQMEKRSAWQDRGGFMPPLAARLWQPLTAEAPEAAKRRRHGCSGGSSCMSLLRICRLIRR